MISTDAHVRHPLVYGTLTHIVVMFVHMCHAMGMMGMTVLRKDKKRKQS